MEQTADPLPHNTWMFWSSRSCVCAAIRPKTCCTDQNLSSITKPPCRSCSEKEGATGCRFPQGSRRKCFNAAAVLRRGKIRPYQKGQLPNYGVFDEKRYFSPGQTPLVIEQKGLRYARYDLRGHLGFGLAGRISGWSKQKLDMIVNLSASPFYAGKIQQRNVLARCAHHFCALLYCNLVGGQDELVFDGRSMIVNAGRCGYTGDGI